MQKIKLKVKLKKGSELMIKKIAWDAFKNTGDINTYLEFKQIQELEKGIDGKIFDNIENDIKIEKKFEE